VCACECVCMLLQSLQSSTARHKLPPDRAGHSRRSSSCVHLCVCVCVCESVCACECVCMLLQSLQSSTARHKRPPDRARHSRRSSSCVHLCVCAFVCESVCACECVYVIAVPPVLYGTAQAATRQGGAQQTQLILCPFVCVCVCVCVRVCAHVSVCMLLQSLQSSTARHKRPPDRARHSRRSSSCVVFQC